MEKTELNQFRDLAESMGLNGFFQIILRHPDGRKEIKAFDLPEKKAIDWMDFWQGSEITIPYLGFEIYIKNIRSERFGDLFSIENDIGEPRMRDVALPSLALALTEAKKEIDNYLNQNYSKTKTEKKTNE